jgi:hypothetical protein
MASAIHFQPRRNEIRDWIGVKPTLALEFKLATGWDHDLDQPLRRSERVLSAWAQNKVCG